MSEWAVLFMLNDVSQADGQEWHLSHHLMVYALQVVGEPCTWLQQKDIFCIRIKEMSLKATIVWLLGDRWQGQMPCIRMFAVIINVMSLSGLSPFSWPFFSAIVALGLWVRDQPDLYKSLQLSNFLGAVTLRVPLNSKRGFINSHIWWDTFRVVVL